ncbi:MAG TPA: trehalose-6-phosphate synthase [Alphaproteobacteria bacterium]|mgnify:CR=1 FL=1|nr:trehalose-6-phosphate synthase [Alphaproteobacteria bacterium]
MENKVIVVSTRPPKAPLSGGMAPAVSRACQNFESVVWFAVENAGGVKVGFNGQADSRSAGECLDTADPIVTTMVEGMVVKTLQVNAGIWNSHYNLDSNEHKWPFTHEHFHRVIMLDATDLFGNFYVNDRIAQGIAAFLEEDSRTPIWIHDYHHFALPPFLRKHGVKNPIVFFNHVPMPDPEAVKSLPVEMQAHFITTLKGLLDCDAVMFQTGETARRAMVLLGVSNPQHLGFYDRQVATALKSGRPMRFLVGNYPISIDTPAIMHTAAHGQMSQVGKEIAQDMVADYIMINFERCDYSKGILQRLRAFKKLLDNHPEMKGKVQIVVGAEPTRGDIAAYREYAQSVRDLSESINSDPSSWCKGKPPVLLQYRNLSHDDVLLLMRNGENGQRKVCTVTSYTDGMNLVSKEFAAAQDPRNAGVLLLSSGTGAAAELYLQGRGAVVYDSRARDMSDSGGYENACPPGDDSVNAIYHAMLESIRMPQEEANRRCAMMQSWLREYSLSKWADKHVECFRELDQAREFGLVPSLRGGLLVPASLAI